jgi:hypothetical protein
MRLTVTLLVLLLSSRLLAQSDDGLRTAKMLSLDTTISGAKAFNDQLLKCAPGYTFKFVDKESPNELKYLYEHSNRETLKIEYAYRQRQSDSSSKPRPIIFSQKIVADNNTIALIYNCMFGENIKAEQLEAFSGMGRGFVFQDRDYHYSLLPDDYKPGYWILAFTE